MKSYIRFVKELRRETSDFCSLTRESQLTARVIAITD